MDKWTGITINEYEIVDPSEPEDPEYEYEILTIDSLLEQTKTDKQEFIRTYSAVNIHKVLSEETYSDCMRLIDQQRLASIEGLNAIVFLLLKPKGERNTLHQLTSLDKYRQLIEMALEYQVPIGFDSCSANSFLQATQDKEEYKKLEEFVEPCESTLFSGYVDVDARVFPCSFAVGCPEWEEGIDLLQYDTFLEVWNHPRLQAFREKLWANNRCCPLYDLKMY